MGFPKAWAAVSIEYFGALMPQDIHIPRAWRRIRLPTDMPPPFQKSHSI